MPSQQEAPKPMLNEVTGPLLLLVLAVLYGGNVPLLKLIENTSPLSITAPELLLLRFVSASALVIPWICLNLRAVREAFLPAVELAFYLWIGYNFQIFGLEKTSAAVTSVIFASVGLIVQGLELVFDKKVPSREVLGFSLGTLFGIGLFVSSPGTQETGMFESIMNNFSFWCHPKLPHEAWLAGVPGEALVFGGAFFFAVHVWRCNKMVQGRCLEGRGQDKSESHSKFMCALGTTQLVLVALLCTVFGYFDSPYNSLEMKVAMLERLGGNLWLQIAVCGMLCTGLPCVAELFAFEVVSPEIASLIYCTMPLWGTVLGAVFLHESFGMQSVFAGAIILVCSLAPSILEIMGKNKPEEDTMPLLEVPDDYQLISEDSVASDALSSEGQQEPALEPEFAAASAVALLAAAGAAGVADGAADVAADVAAATYMAGVSASREGISVAEDVHQRDAADVEGVDNWHAGGETLIA